MADFTRVIQGDIDILKMGVAAGIGIDSRDFHIYHYITQNADYMDYADCTDYADYSDYMDCTDYTEYTDYSKRWRRKGDLFRINKTCIPNSYPIAAVIF